MVFRRAFDIEPGDAIVVNECVYLVVAARMTHNASIYLDIVHPDGIVVIYGPLHGETTFAVLMSTP